MNSYKLLLPFVCMFLLSACSTSYTLSATDTSGAVKPEILIGNEQAVVQAIHSSVVELFPSDPVQVTGIKQRTFAWRHMPLLDATNFVLDIKKAKGTDAAGQTFDGYFYTIDTHGTQGLVKLKYVDPLNETIHKNLANYGVLAKIVSNFVEIDDGAEFIRSANQAKECFSAINDMPELSILKAKISLSGVDGQNFSMLSNNAKPNPSETKALMSLGRQREICHKMEVASNYSNKPSQIKGIIEDKFAVSQTLIAGLIMGKISYAEYAEKIQALESSTNSAILQIEAELRKQSAEAKFKADQLAAQERQNVILMQQTFNQQIQHMEEMSQRRIEAQQPTRVIRGPSFCNFMGNTVSCN